MKRNPRPVLAIGGLDPSGYAGVLADARVFESLGRPYCVAVTAITAQSEKRFFSWEPVALQIFRDQLRAAGEKIAGVKIGMLGDVVHLAEVLRWLRRVRPSLVLWDPVWRSSTGARLLEVPPDHRDLKALLRLSDVFTPNLPEAEWLLERKIGRLEEARAAAIALWSQGEKPGRIVVLKGGHLHDPRHRSRSVDWLVRGGRAQAISAVRRPGQRRGSGCSFASALLVALVDGTNPVSAVRRAKAEVCSLWSASPRPSASTRRIRSGIASLR